MESRNLHKKVLIIDDDNDVLDVMQEALSYEGFEVKILDNSKNIFSEIGQYHPDILILDYILNGINGGEVCHQIKANTATSRLPVIMMSAYPKVLKSVGDYGCDAFIAKPFDLDDIVKNIQTLTPVIIT